MTPYAQFPQLSEDDEIYDIESFWQWFEEKNRWFLDMIRRDGHTASGEFPAIFKSRLEKLNKELGIAAGSLANGNVDMVLTVDGKIKNIVFAEDIIAAAPKLPGWRFTALMPQTMPDDQLVVNTSGLTFNVNNVFFFSNTHPDRPDLIDITLLYTAQSDMHTNANAQACYQYVMALVGEREMLTMIDDISIRMREPGDPELIPINKLNAFLRWRESEFVEKYKDLEPATGGEVPEDAHIEIGGAPVGGGPEFRANVPNRYLLCREETAPYPWLLSVHITYDGSAIDGFPDKETLEKIKTFELELSAAIDMYAKGTLELFSNTCNGNYTIFFAGNEFRQLSKVTEETIGCYGKGFNINYNIIKDKYWKSINVFRQACMHNGGMYTT